MMLVIKKHLSPAVTLSKLLPLRQRFPDFLPPGTGFVEDDFSADRRGWGLVSG